MLVVDWMELSEGAIHLTEVSAVVLLGGTMNVVHHHQYKLGLVEGELVSGDPANLGAKALNCRFEGAPEIEDGAECLGFEQENFPGGGTFNSGFDGFEDVISQPPVVNGFRTTIGMFCDLVDDVITYRLPESDGGPFFRPDGGLNRVVAIICFHFRISASFNVGGTSGAPADLRALIRAAAVLIRGGWCPE